MCMGQNLNPCPFFVHRSDNSGNNTYYYMECVWFKRDSHPNVGIDADWGLVAQRGLVARENSAFYLVSCRLGSVSPSGSVSPREVCILLDIKNITCLLFFYVLNTNTRLYWSEQKLQLKFFFQGDLVLHLASLILCGSSY